MPNIQAVELSSRWSDSLIYVEYTLSAYKLICLAD